jgi:hypothetical protein
MASSSGLQPPPPGTPGVQPTASTPESLKCMEAMNSNVGKINSLQAQIQELHVINDHLAQASIQSQVVEPEFKRIKVALDDQKMTLLELRAYARSRTWSCLVAGEVK